MKFNPKFDLIPIVISNTKMKSQMIFRPVFKKSSQREFKIKQKFVYKIQTIKVILKLKLRGCVKSGQRWQTTSLGI